MATSAQRCDSTATVVTPRLLPQIPRSSFAAVHPQSFSHPHSYSKTKSWNEVARSLSDNKHYDNSFATSSTVRHVSYRKTTKDETTGTPRLRRQSSRQSPPSAGQRTRVSVLRSQSQVSQRPPPGRPVALDKVANKTRYSCDSGGAPLTAGGSAQLTLVLMGAPMVGKSAIVNQFLFEIFLRDYRPTVDEFNWIEYGSEEGESRSGSSRRYSNSNLSSSGSVDSTESERSSSGASAASGSAVAAGQRLLLQIIDSAGSRDFLAMRHLYYKIGDAFMIVYSVDDQLSYAEALLMVREIQQRNTKNVPILLVANKTDVEDESATDFDAGAKCRPAILAEFPVPQNIDFIRISAKNLNQVKQAFNRLIDELAQKREICGGMLRRAQLQKRRQSMPSRRTANELGIDAETLERLLRQHDHHTRHSQCVIS